MATEKQISANRANAQKSTGPTSAEGKAASSRNAFRTGFYCETLIARREDEEHVRTLVQEYYTFYNPATPPERDLVDMLIRDIHMIRRVTRAETSLWNHQWESLDRVSNDAEHGAAVKSAGLDFGRIQRRLNQLDRNFHETRERLEAIQERRRAAPDAEPDPAPFEGEAIEPEPDFFTPKYADSTTTSPEIGFVPSNASEPSPEPPSQEIGFVPSTPPEAPPQAFGFVPSACMGQASACGPAFQRVQPPGKAATKDSTLRENHAALDESPGESHAPATGDILQPS